jgi:hypothetical protein
MRSPRSSATVALGQGGLAQAEHVFCLSGGGRETIILRTHAGDLEFQGLNPGTQSGDLVEQTPIGRRAYVTVEGLSHGDSLGSTDGPVLVAAFSSGKR